MELVKDAVSTPSIELNSITYFSKERINAHVLKKMISDLDELDIISIIFLMTDINTDITKVIDLLKKDPIKKFNELVHENNWEEKLLEILIISDNVQVLRRLGFSDFEINGMKERFTWREHNVSLHINRAIKSLYFLCDELFPSEAKKLVQKVNNELSEPVEIDENKICLELYILHWIQQKYITIDKDNPNLNGLIKNLKSIHLCDFNFDYWEIINKNQQDSTKIQNSNNNNSLLLVNNNVESNICQVANLNDPWVGDHKRLCIIINERKFNDEAKYPFRKGSDIDEEKLKKTFEGCKFDVIIHRDFTKLEMLNFLESLNGHPFNNYRCIFMCILSHGYNGKVVFTDDETINITLLEKKFCCYNLQNVFKLMLLQACQGNQLGLVDRSSLVADGPEGLPTCGIQSPVYRLHFGLFQATISEFVAMRHESEGSWFIQDACLELEQSTPIKVKEWVERVTLRVSNRRSKSEFKDKDYVQVPPFYSTISKDYMIPKYSGTH